MKPNDTQTPLPEDHLFDLLVDGQLDEPRRRELLSSLDDRPGGWRRCALAFLEAQSWSEAMAAFSRPSAAKERVESIATTPARRRRHDYLTTLLGMAASFLLAIGLTSLAHDMRRQGPGPATYATVGADLPGFGPTGAPMSLVGQTPDATEQGIHVVGLSGMGGDGKQHTYGLPAIARDRLDERWLRDLPSAIPEEVTQSLRRAGHDVELSRQLIPFQLKDGRRLVVPVDQVDVRQAMYPYYQ
ncbi:MAG: hypothetical protein GX621_14510 [Pirellulaceae bacterium]|nr:hypothetical protein [Pirellulaceae bacterium]